MSTYHVLPDGSVVIRRQDAIEATRGVNEENQRILVHTQPEAGYSKK